MVEVSLKELIAAGAHFGHQTRRWNPKMLPYLYGEKDGVHIFDLTKTKEMLDEALGVLEKVSKENKTILFVGTKKQAKDKVKEIAVATESFYINERWLGGVLTNFEQVKRSCLKLIEFKKGLENNLYKDRTKRERLLIDRDVQRLSKFFGGIVGMSELPSLVVLVDVRRERAAIKECLVVGVETIGIVDSNSDPTFIDYPIPMNDDATRALDYVLDLMKEAILRGKGKKPEKAKEKVAEKTVKKVKNKDSKKSTNKSAKKKSSGEK